MAPGLFETETCLDVLTSPVSPTHHFTPSLLHHFTISLLHHFTPSPFHSFTPFTHSFHSRQAPGRRAEAGGDGSGSRNGSGGRRPRFGRRSIEPPADAEDESKADAPAASIHSSHGDAQPTTTRARHSPVPMLSSPATAQGQSRVSLE